ncbi:hypothetical protein BCJMU51_p74 (plasmid) [Bacillus cereus]|uniref:hypothetical protein n=1 Tax=Bacillus cereus TaxID=1396 RepID=UPI001F2E2DD8|nr:hypothetical protein [Bacillus cereus]BCC27261.1 hypothetical protein BCM0079_p303 [Bacillus cereus]BCC27269.1 hypothetical protein BCM0079_p311 [Bacillus cereus]BCC38832.1 hypothetical protein BCM0105_p56 [Bacillus cereus]BCC44686.1 hypothetical protein BCJMU01_p53 [Bacillus cereus]BCC68310.1 hypothetical protein BCJMU39_p37 [Bacillus cereus]
MEVKKIKIKPKKIVRNEENHKLEFDKVRLSIEIPISIRDNFKEAVEKNGKTMKEVLEAYMQRYSVKELLTDLKEETIDN